MREAQKFCFASPHLRASRGVHIWTGNPILWRYTYTVQSNYHTRSTLSLLQTELAEKKQQINVFNTLHSLVSDLKSVIGLSPPFTGLGRGTTLLASLYTPLFVACHIEIWKILIFGQYILVWISFSKNNFHLIGLILNLFIISWNCFSKFNEITKQ